MFYLSVTAVTQGILWSEDLDLFNISKGCAWEEDTEAPTAQWLMGSWCNIFSRQHLDIWKGWQNMWKTNHVGVKTCGRQNIKTMDRSSAMSYYAAVVEARAASFPPSLHNVLRELASGLDGMKIGLSQLQMALNLTSIQKRGSKSNYTAAGPGMVDLNLQRLKDVAHLMNQLKKAKTEIRELNDEIKEMKHFIYELNLKLHYDDGSWPPIAVPESWGSRPMNDEDPMWSPNPKPKAVRDCWWTLAGMKPWTYAVVWTAEAFVSWEAEKMGWVGGSVSCWQLHSVTTAWPFHIRSKVAGQFNSSWKNMT